MGDARTVADHVGAQRIAALRRGAHGGSRYHVVSALGLAQCGSRWPLDQAHAVALEYVPPRLRCASVGCAQFWRTVR